MIRIGDVENLIETAYTDFVYPARREVLVLLENEVGSTGNAVVQEGSNPFREADLSVVVESLADLDLLRGYEETGDEVEFVDPDGLARVVLILTMSPPAMRGASTWDVTMHLLETAAPE